MTDHGMTQFTLFPDPRPLVQPAAGGTVQERFERFHAANPWVYEALERLAADLIARGRSRVGVGMLYEVVRWSIARATTDEASGYKLDNYYRSRYARLLLDRHPEWRSRFEIRKLTAE